MVAAAAGIRARRTAVSGEYNERTRRLAVAGRPRCWPWSRRRPGATPHRRGGGRARVARRWPPPCNSKPRRQPFPRGPPAARGRLPPPSARKMREGQAPHPDRAAPFPSSTAPAAHPPIIAVDAKKTAWIGSFKTGG